jgi:hypothetical protein
MTLHFQDMQKKFWFWSVYVCIETINAIKEMEKTFRLMELNDMSFWRGV